MKITKTWANKYAIDFETRIHETSNYDWIAHFPHLQIRGNDKKIIVYLQLGGVRTELPHIKTVEEIKALIKLLTGKKYNP